MAELELHIECRKCRRVAVTKLEAVSPFEQHRLKCSHCGARDPIVTEQERRIPFTPEYEKSPVVRVRPAASRE